MSGSVSHKPTVTGSAMRMKITAATAAMMTCTRCSRVDRRLISATPSTASATCTQPSTMRSGGLSSVGSDVPGGPKTSLSAAKL